jgi:hypothetical protein
MKFFGSEDYAGALERHNRQHARASDSMAKNGKITADERIYVPEKKLIEMRYGDTIKAQTPQPMSHP